MMKKIIFSVAIAATLFVGCSKDDGPSKKCESCTSDAGNRFEICDNGDGTYKSSENGVSETITKEELLGLSVKEAVKLACDLDLEF